MMTHTTPNAGFERSPIAKAVAHLHYEYRANEVLLPYQKYWIEDKSQLKIAEKSRRTGITWAEAADAALTTSSVKLTVVVTISMLARTKRWHGVYRCRGHVGQSVR